MIDEVLKFAMSDKVKSQDTVFFLAALATSKQGREKAWKMFKDNKTEFKDRYIGGPLISRLIKVRDDMTEVKIHQLLCSL